MSDETEPRLRRRSLGTRVSPEARAALEREASARGMTVSNLTRNLIEACARELAAEAA